ncbi:MAG: DNA polymerase III subunit beta [Candidatus Nanopelagicales bacterium]|nr:DNA polymerase III subunit beta [Candidatus Nanopelagicales bacterium]
MAEAVAWASRTLPTKSTQPILTGMHLVADKSGLVLSGSDADVSARANLTAEVIEAGTVLIPGRLLADITRSLPSAIIDFALVGNRAQITCGRSTFTIPIMPVAEYPPLPAMPSISGNISGTDFASAISQVAIAASRDETLPAFTGVKIDVDGSTITMAATDRYRLAVRELNWSPISTSLSTHALIPAKFLAESSKSLAHSESISLAFATGNEGLVGIEGSGRQTTSRMLAADFPKYRTLLPAESNTVAQLSTSALAESVKRVSLVLEREAPIRITFTNGEATITGGGGSGELAEAKESIECTLTGDELTIAFNYQFLLDGLNAIDSSISVISMTTPIRPAVISGASDFGAQSDDSFKYLLMPIRQQ